MQNKKQIHKAKKTLELKTEYSFVRAKKALGQNFLKSKSALRKIIEAGEISPSDIILEIGPGKGALTEKLLEKSNCVIAIEKDRELVKFLQEKFEKEIAEEKLILINDDILKFDIEKTIFPGFASSNFLSLRPSPSTGWDPRDEKIERSSALSKTLHPLLNYKIIANIPYNITGAILKKFLTEKIQPERMVLLVQKEVAERILARGGKESILSISVKAYGEPKIILKVPRRYFSPEPKVDSAVLLIKNISRRFFIENKTEEEKFWEIIHAGFAHKRKKLSSNLKKYLTENQKISLKNKRAEDLNIEEWISFVLGA